MSPPGRCWHTAGRSELHSVLGSVQNAASTDRERGVALWVVNNDGTRPDAWLAPFHVSDYLAGLYDFQGSNVVGATNEVTVVDLVGNNGGLEMVFAGFDGRIHAVDSSASGRLWSATSPRRRPASSDSSKHYPEHLVRLPKQ